MYINKINQSFAKLAQKSYLPSARLALFAIYFWFGLLKILDLSPATPLARALVNKTIGASAFDTFFMLLAVSECVIGILFLLPKFTRLAVYLLLAHMAIVCSPLFLVPSMAWDSFLVPTLEGQYIIKNLALIALALTVFVSLKARKK